MPLRRIGSSQGVRRVGSEVSRDTLRHVAGQYGVRPAGSEEGLRGCGLAGGAHNGLHPADLTDWAAST